MTCLKCDWEVIEVTLPDMMGGVLSTEAYTLKKDAVITSYAN